jgi:drug/metabolite transporter (DMT)-like permease
MSYLALIAAQLLYTVSDTWKKLILGEAGFSAATLVKPIFLVATSIALIGFVFQMYALSKMDLSRTIVGLGMLAVLFSTAAGVFFFKEQLNGWNYLGLGMALVAILLVNLK